ncbi:G-D-S-L family lipolytic protein [Flavobacterium sp. ZT3R18]|uniref:SGNH/GDSL hydrolase family protein n=1 Tax=Flavobacterium sp. ZT3R18 TaxID=2594429 RepID=UPI00117A12C4|nr:SGNH/GDSL hydrolase family protein [Flavobacterium sp. ZT3R18]TRX34115.1 G-D-S-L family lipolytic protein [Flavobacterium sp. ZT3R18]
MIKNFKWLLLVSLSFVACNNNDDDSAPVEIPITPGTAVLTKYVALGDSFAAGYSDGALFKAGQANSYVNILAQQFIPAGGVAITTPFMVDNVGGFSNGGVQVLPKFPTRLTFNGAGPVNVSGVSGTAITAHLTGSFSNMGIPGAKSYHLIAPGYGNLAGVFATPATASPYFARFSSSPTSTTLTVLDDAMAQNPTFFSLWIGGNDVLGYATTGGDGTDPITPTANFNFAYDKLITGLTAKGAKGVVANLPYVSALPFFTTVGFNPVTLVAAQVTALNGAYASYNGGLVAAKNAGLITEAERVQRTINFAVGKNAVVMIDEYLTDITAVSPGLIKLRQTTNKDYIVLSSQGTSAKDHLLAGNGTSAPLKDRWVLSESEVKEIKTATDAYNITIEATATAKGLAFVDTRTTMEQLSTGGIRFGNFQMTSAYVTGGAFSLDGVHPSARGYALIANLFVDAINTKYTATLRHVDLSVYPIQYPAIIP